MAHSVTASFRCVVPADLEVMDDYMFRSYVTEFKYVHEETSYLEIFNYSVSCPVILRVKTGW